jgi:hypothetical protein
MQLVLFESFLSEREIYAGSNEKKESEREKSTGTEVGQGGSDRGTYFGQHTCFRMTSPSEVVPPSVTRTAAARTRTARRRIRTKGPFEEKFPSVRAN